MKTQSYRSGLERTFHQKFPTLPYEKNKVEYVILHKYTPDFTLAPNLYVESKGLFKGADRSNHLHIQQQHPEVRVLFVFQNHRLTLSKKSKTTYADWCNKNGFVWLSINEVGNHTQDSLIALLNAKNQ